VKGREKKIKDKSKKGMAYWSITTPSYKERRGEGETGERDKRVRRGSERSERKEGEGRKE
jgi:hypothetical protein